MACLPGMSSAKRCNEHVMVEVWHLYRLSWYALITVMLRSEIGHYTINLRQVVFSKRFDVFCCKILILCFVNCLPLYTNQYTLWNWYSIYNPPKGSKRCAPFFFFRTPNTRFLFPVLLLSSRHAFFESMSSTPPLLLSSPSPLPPLHVVIMVKSSCQK